MKSRLLFPSLFLLAPAAAPAFADTVTQTVPFDYDAGTVGVTFPVLQGFDTLGGTRVLNGVNFEFRNTFELDLFFESTGPTPLADGDFSLDFAFITLFQLGLPGEKGDPPPPLFGPGAFFAGGISGALAAYDGIPGNDGPDSFRRSITDSLVFSQHYTEAEPEVLGAVTDVGPLTTVWGGFTELFFAWINDPGWPFPPGGVPEYPSDAAVWVQWPFRHFGEIEVTYEYTEVPEPASLFALAAFVLLRTVSRRV